MTAFASAEVFSDPQILTDKQQWKIAGLLDSPKAVSWLNKGMNANNGVPSEVEAIQIISFNFNKGAKEAIKSLTPVPFDKIGVISAYAELALANGQKDGGILIVDNPGQKDKVQAFWVSAQKISGFLKTRESLQTGGQPLPNYRHADFADAEVQNCAAQSFLVRPVGPENYAYQRWVRCSNPDEQKSILTPKSLVPEEY
ncbi:50s ribosomal protein l18 [Lasius niger]|uniref:50s ribosomal protein l18 n=1 Tax=Lasius niger TaxID=67767 RepID=A0A0J7K6U8_LASNI|nr:50s ribosomal protein l18 [Lasius niger]